MDNSLKWPRFNIVNIQTISDALGGKAWYFVIEYLTKNPMIDVQRFRSASEHKRFIISAFD